MASSATMAALMGTMSCTPSRPSGMSSVSAASGPYAAELSASRPKIGMPAMGPMCSARSSLVASGRPKQQQEVIAEAEQVQLSPRDSLRVLELLENPPGPNARLLAAARALPVLP
jgi:hypothetical protein